MKAPKHSAAKMSRGPAGPADLANRFTAAAMDLHRWVLGQTQREHTPQPGAGQLRAQARFRAKLKANAKAAEEREAAGIDAPESRQVQRRRDLLAWRRARSAKAAEVLAERRRLLAAKRREAARRRLEGAKP